MERAQCLGKLVKSGHYFMRSPVLALPAPRLQSSLSCQGGLVVPQPRTLRWQGRSGDQKLHHTPISRASFQPPRRPEEGLIPNPLTLKPQAYGLEVCFSSLRSDPLKLVCTAPKCTRLGGKGPGECAGRVITACLLHTTVLVSYGCRDKLPQIA